MKYMIIAYLILAVAAANSAETIRVTNSTTGETSIYVVPSPNPYVDDSSQVIYTCISGCE